MKSKILPIILGILLCVSLVGNVIQFNQNKANTNVINETNESITELNNQIASLNEQINKQNETITELNKQLETVKADSEKALQEKEEELAKTKSDMEQAIAEKDKIIEELQQELEELKNNRVAQTATNNTQQQTVQQPEPQEQWNPSMENSDDTGVVIRGQASGDGSGNSRENRAAAPDINHASPDDVRGGNLR